MSPRSRISTASTSSGKDEPQKGRARTLTQGFMCCSLNRGAWPRKQVKNSLTIALLAKLQSRATFSQRKERVLFSTLDKCCMALTALESNANTLRGQPDLQRWEAESTLWRHKGRESISWSRSWCLIYIISASGGRV